MTRQGAWLRLVPLGLAVALCLPILAGAAATPSRTTTQEAGVQLGRRLFYDADLSADGSMSCATCHAQRHAFADGNRTHPGVTDEPGVRNVPSLANVGAFSTLTWIDQHVTRLDRQFFIPVMGHHPVEMGMPDRATLTNRIARNACYRVLFARAFPRTGGRIDADTIAAAVALFERTLVSRGSAWDQTRQGHGALAAEAAHGQALFFGRAHCAACHTGMLFTDMRFHTIDPSHPARIRTPSLRNVAVTAPYLHDGSAPTLRQAIAAHGQTLPDDDEAALESFLRALTDEHFLHDPALALPPEACPA
ncbi:cytochrome-c peroxidase [Gluconacetobacter sp. Hr-1-5]|uniref:cytochrome-c peroxidase n=1 Tax=Gluconacetobacter sp. Hr-1-5 TaxID=3395370 RepID=UPI003B517570